MKKYLMLMAILAVGTTAMAEEKIASEKLKETVITAENFEASVLDTAKNVTIVTQDEIKNKGANTVAEALRGVPGLIVSSMDGSDPRFDLRGYGATASQNTLVLIDGIPLNNVQGSGYYTNQIPVNMIEKIEIIPSGGAVMYGDGATGGVINIITKAPLDDKNYGAVGLEVGSWDTINGNVNYGTKLTDRFLMNVAYSGYRSEGYRDKNQDKGFEKYDKDDKRESTWVRGKYLLDNGSLEANYRHNKLKDYYTGYLTKEQFEENPNLDGSGSGVAKSIEDSYTLKYTQKLNDKFDFMVYGGYEELEYEGLSLFDPLYGESKIKYLASQYYVKPQIKYNYGENSYIILGGDYKDGKSEDKLNTLAKDKTRKSYAGYILNKTTVGDWQFTQGYRREKIKYEADIKEDYYGEIKGTKENHTADSYELGVNYLYSDTGSVYFNFADGYRSPSIQDMGAWKGNLKLQTSKSYELGLKDTYRNTYISSSVFLIDTDDEIYYDKRIGYGVNKNFDGEVRRIGTQLSLNHYFNKLTLRENITYIQPKITSGKDNGKDFAGIPRWNINLGATYSFTEKLVGNIDMYYQSSTYAEDDFGNEFGKGNDHITFDTNVNYKFNDGLEVYGGIKNLFDEEYANAVISSQASKTKVYYPADGRSYYAGFRYTF